MSGLTWISAMQPDTPRIPPGDTTATTRGGGLARRYLGPWSPVRLDRGHQNARRRWGAAVIEAPDTAAP